MDAEKAYLVLKDAIDNSPIVVPCQNTDPEIWFGDPNNTYDTSALAKRLCKMCPARQACAEYAIVSNQLFGIWGGLSRKQRQRLRVPKVA